MIPLDPSLSLLDPSLSLLVLLGLALLASLVRHGPKPTAMAFLNGLRWFAALCAGLCVAVLGIASLVVMLAAVLVGGCLCFGLLLLVLLVCAWLLPVLVIGGLIAISGVDSIPT